MGQMRFMAELDMWFIVSLVLHLREEIKTTLAYDSIFLFFGWNSAGILSGVCLSSLSLLKGLTE